MGFLNPLLMFVSQSHISDVCIIYSAFRKATLQCFFLLNLPRLLIQIPYPQKPGKIREKKSANLKASTVKAAQPCQQNSAVLLSLQ